MPDNADYFHNFIKTTGICCSFVSGLIINLILRHFLREVDQQVGSSSRLQSKRDNYHSADMAAMNPIDISSSDSDSEDWDLDDYRDLDESPPRESADLANSRILPSWAAGNSSAVTGQSPSFQTVPYPKRAYTLSGNSSNSNNQAQAKLPIQSNSNNDGRTSNMRIGRDENSKVSAASDFDKYASQPAVKRTLPTSFLASGSNARPSYLAENVGSSHIRETHGKSYHSDWQSLANGKNYMRDRFGRGADDDLIIYESSGSRVLPPSFMHGKSVSTTQHVNSNDPLHRSGIADEMVAGNDERLIYQAALQDLNQPKVEASLPDGLLSVPLLRHQKIALAWMLQKETRSLHCLGGILADDQGLGKTVSMIALIQIQRSLQLKSKPEDLSSHRTEALNLDEDDGHSSAPLDKTKPIGESDVSTLVPEVSTSAREFHRGRPAAGTLVVCPASVLRQWARELDEKVADESKLSVLVYHGSNRTRDPIELAKYDVVLTTYAIVTNEVPKQPLVEEDDDDHKNGERYGLSSDFAVNKKRKKLSNGNKKRKKGGRGIDAIACDYGALAKVGWFRVILDEAQTIKNHRTQVARACCGLRAKRRWCLSGTPIQNTIDELFSYFRFLRYDPYAVYKSFCSTIKFPISRNSMHGYKKLQVVLRAIMLRRTKGTLLDGEPIINLPPKRIHLTKVNFSPEERAFYSKLEAESRSQFKAYAAAGTVNQNYANILLMLLRLRQACDHPLLVKGQNSDFVGKVSSETAKRLPTDMLMSLLNLLETSKAICRVCSDPPEDAVVTVCGHVFCYQCVSDYLTGDDNMCPVPECKEQLGSDVVFSEATIRSCISDNLVNHPSTPSEFSEQSTVLQNEYSSSKIKAALEILLSHCKPELPRSQSHPLENCNGNSSLSGPTYSDSGADAAKNSNDCLNSQSDRPVKAIVFSQWTSMLDLIELSLDRSSLIYRRLDGRMSLVARDKAVKEFNNDPEVTVMLMSLKAGNLGLNMVAASRVILLDLWWNPTTEDQAVDRAHRIGQTRPVTVSRLTIKDTVEDRILALQEEKRKMVASAFGEDQSGGSATRLTVEDLKYLFMV